MPENRAKTGQFLKGKSGNPGGRPRIPADVKELIRQNTIKAVETVIALMDSESDRVALMAATALLDRAWGKPMQAQELQVDMNEAVDMRAEIREFLLERETERERLEHENAR